MNGRHSEEKSAPRLRRYFNSLSSHLATPGYSFGTPVRLCNISHTNVAGIIAERSSRSGGEIPSVLGRGPRGKEFEIHVEAQRFNDGQ